MPTNRGVQGDGFAAPLEVQDELDLTDTKIGLGFEQSTLGGDVVDPAVLPDPFPTRRYTSANLPGRAVPATAFP